MLEHVKINRLYFFRKRYRKVSVVYSLNNDTDKYELFINKMLSMRM